MEIVICNLEITFVIKLKSCLVIHQVRLKGNNMSLIKWHPMYDLDQWFDQSQAGFAPAVDVWEDENNVYIETPLPGMDPEQVDISIENDVLTIEGSHEKKSEVDDKNYYRKEVRIGSFHRAVALPATVKSDKAEASYQNGMLTITVPKEERAKPKKVKIDVKK